MVQMVQKVKRSMAEKRSKTKDKQSIGFGYALSMSGFFWLQELIGSRIVLFGST
jgi:hypothetical protein